MSDFCSKCGNLLQGKRSTAGTAILQCVHCGSEISQQGQITQSTPLSDDPEFSQKLKLILRQGREIKPIRSLARQLGLQENNLHEMFKQLDHEAILPFGYYDKIDRTYVRTHSDEELDEGNLLDMIYQSYGYKVFHHGGLTAYIRLGKPTSSRKVLNALHLMRKKNKIKGWKKGVNWLWRLPNPNADPNDEDESPPDNVLGTEDLTKEDEDKRSKRKSSPRTKGARGHTATKNSEVEEEEEQESENMGLAELARAAKLSLDSKENDDDEVEIVFSDDDDDS
ncbi:MAG TPA: hypothetical protein VJ044_05960 [Candidatus Hodarchaeales archaeon]|nr:hypothetical protein [Candidatus Hodarchaeales archaeon]